MNQYIITFSRVYEITEKQILERLKSNPTEESKKAMAEEIARDYLAVDMETMTADTDDFASATIRKGSKTTY